jgi:hypothetical protein
MADGLSQLSSDPFISHFLDGMPPEVADSFTPAQLQAVRRAFGMRYVRSHAIDLRRSLGLLGRRFYVVVLVGRERHGDARRPRALWPFGVAAATAVTAALLLLM